MNDHWRELYVQKPMVKIMGMHTPPPPPPPQPFSLFLFANKRNKKIDGFTQNHLQGF